MREVEDNKYDYFKNLSDEGLVKYMVKNRDNSSQNIAKGEIAIRQTRAIKEFNKASTKYSKRIVWLTWVIIVLTFIMALQMFLSRG